MQKREPSYIVAGNINWCIHCGTQYSGSSKKPKIELPYDPTIPLLGIHLEKRKALIWKDICTPVFIAVLSTKATYTSINK